MDYHEQLTYSLNMDEIVDRETEGLSTQKQRMGTESDPGRDPVTIDACDESYRRRRYRVHAQT